MPYGNEQSLFASVQEKQVRWKDEANNDSTCVPLLAAMTAATGFFRNGLPAV